MKRNEMLFVAYQSLMCMCLFGPYWQELVNVHMGIGQTQIFAIEILMCPLLMFLEIGSGVFADRFSRKFMLLMAPLCCAVSIFMLGIAQGLWMYCASDLLWGMGFVFMSGADVALLRDSINGQQAEKHFRKILNLSHGIRFLGMASSHVVAGVLVGTGIITNLRITVIANIPITLLAFVVALGMKEPMRNKFTSAGEIVRIGAFQVFKQPKVLLTGIFFGCLMLSGTHLFFQPYFLMINLPKGIYGIAFALFNFVAMSASFFSQKIEKLIGIYGAMLLILVTRIMSWLFMASFFPVWGWIFIFPEEISRGMAKPMMDDLVNKEVSSEVRATALSIMPQFVRLIELPIFIFAGMGIDAGMFSAELRIFSVFVVVGSGIAIILLRKNGKFCHR